MIMEAASEWLSKWPQGEGQKSCKAETHFKITFLKKLQDMPDGTMEDEKGSLVKPKRIFKPGKALERYQKYAQVHLKTAFKKTHKTEMMKQQRF